MKFEVLNNGEGGFVVVNESNQVIDCFPHEDNALRRALQLSHMEVKKLDDYFSIECYICDNDIIKTCDVVKATVNGIETEICQKCADIFDLYSK